MLGVYSVQYLIKYQLKEVQCTIDQVLRVKSELVCTSRKDFRGTNTQLFACGPRLFREVVKK